MPASLEKLQTKIIKHFLANGHMDQGTVKQKGVEWRVFYKCPDTFYVNPQGKVRMGWSLIDSRLLNVEEFNELLKAIKNAQV